VLIAFDFDLIGLEGAAPSVAHARPVRRPARHRHDRRQRGALEKRSPSLERVATRLKLRGPRFTAGQFGGAAGTEGA
jgi:hypothetical protein